MRGLENWQKPTLATKKVTHHMRGLENLIE